MITNNQPKAFFNTSTISGKKMLVSIAVLVIFHGVGFWGLILSGRQEYFQNLTPLNLLLTALLLFLNHRIFNRSFFVFAFTTFAAGFLAEVAGIHTGFPFGNYVYGKALGLKIWEVPLLIGLNWLLLVYCTGCMVANFKLPDFIKAFIAATLMVMLDFFIEPVAIRFDFWHWENGAIPALNYAGWFAVAMVLQLYFQKSEVTKLNPFALIVFLVQFVFFVALNIYI